MKVLKMVKCTIFEFHAFILAWGWLVRKQLKFKNNMQLVLDLQELGWPLLGKDSVSGICLRKAHLQVVSCSKHSMTRFLTMQDIKTVGKHVQVA